MSHNVEKWRKILSDFQDAFADYSETHCPAYIVTSAERGSPMAPGKRWAQKGVVLGRVPLDQDGRGWVILGLRPGDGPTPEDKQLRKYIDAEIPVVSETIEAFRRFSELASMAGAALPRCIRDVIPVAPANAMSWWLATMWWANPPNESDLCGEGFRLIWRNPFGNSIDTIERCNLTTENPSLSCNKGMANELTDIELSVDVESQQATLRTPNSDATTFDLPSEGVTRWLKVLADKPNKWFLPSQYQQHDKELFGIKPTDKLRSLRRKFPKLAVLIEASKRSGMRFDPSRTAKSKIAPQCANN